MHIDKRRKYWITNRIKDHGDIWTVLWGWTCLICRYEFAPSHDWRRSAVWQARTHVKENHA